MKIVALFAHYFLKIIHNIKEKGKCDE